MTGEPREDMDIPLIDRLPPVVAIRALLNRSDAALSGSPLPPYRPGMYAGRPVSPSISELSAALESEHDVGPTVAEGWPAAWRDDPLLADEPASREEEPSSEGEQPETPPLLFLDEAEIEPIEPERDPTGFEQAAAELESWETRAEPVADASAPWEPEADSSADSGTRWDAEAEPAIEAVHSWETAAEPDAQEVGSWDTAAEEPSEERPEVWAWDSEETAVYDLPPAAGEDTGPWQDSWETAQPVFDEPAADDFRPEVAHEVSPTSDIDPPEPAIAEGPESAGDVQEWLETGTVDIDATLDVEAPVEDSATVEAEAALDAEAEPAALYDSGEWATAEPGEETGELVEMVEEDSVFGATLEFAPAAEDFAEAPADEAWAPFQPREAPAEHREAGLEAEAAVAGEPGDEEPADERVAIVPPTPLDTWYHGEHGVESEATWEAFGRALEEAASWGDLGATIATGLPPEQARAEAAAETHEHEASAADHPPVTAASTEPALEPAVADLARRLEQLAQRLRTEGEKGVEQALTEGDRLEASLAGFIAGYVAARRG